jgi:hypothetical protein
MVRQLQRNDRCEYADGIWEVTLTLTEGAYEYKFSHDAWLGQEALTEGDPCTITTGWKYESYF